MKKVLQITAATLLFVGITAGLFFLARPAKIYNEETRTLVFETSRTYQEGINSQINNYCLEMQTADKEQKLALSKWIIEKANSSKANLNDMARKCLSEANNNLIN